MAEEAEKDSASAGGCGDGKAQLYLNPTFHSITRTNMYPTRTMLYIIGCDQVRKEFRVLALDRSTKDLAIVDDGKVYNETEIQAKLRELNFHHPGLLERKVSGFGIFGVVRFLSGYYILVITKRRKVAMIGGHIVYRIEDMFMAAVYNTSLSNATIPPDEKRYTKMFQNVDTTSNFYFSYTYDLTRPLQSNMYIPSEDEAAGRVAARPRPIRPNTKFVWNHFLTTPYANKVDRRWVIHAMHGFIAQSNLNVFGRPIFVTLIARRSRFYAGTRYLKRGTDEKGNPANDVETEQIVHDASTLCHRSGRFTSFLQVRGSVPLYWQQEQNSMKAKRAISIARSDPFASLASMHFERLLHRYGSPVIAFNLVKRLERKPREALLYEGMKDALAYINQFLGEDEAVRHFAWDMARCNKRNGTVLQHLDKFGTAFLEEIGIFHAGPQLWCTRGDPHNTSTGGTLAYDNPYRRVRGRNQCGVVRVNCVDCLDRTNTAQFMIGLCALRHQLYVLGVIPEVNSASIPFDCLAWRLLCELYEDHGDTIALQYGGSSLVNRIQSYRKRQWTTHSKDILNTVARYYSNSFTDTDKQMAINLFLGKYRPTASTTPLWLLDNDKLLHRHDVLSPTPPSRPPYDKWHMRVTVPTIERFRQSKCQQLDSEANSGQGHLLSQRANDKDDNDRVDDDNDDADNDDVRGDGPLPRAAHVDVCASLPSLSATTAGGGAFADQQHPLAPVNGQVVMPGHLGLGSSVDDDIFATPPSSPPPERSDQQQQQQQQQHVEIGASGVVSEPGTLVLRQGGRRRSSGAAPATTTVKTALVRTPSRRSIKTLRAVYLEVRRQTVQLSREKGDTSFADRRSIGEAPAITGLERFDEEVRQQLLAWHRTTPDGEDYVVAAYYVAARHFAYQGALGVPRLTLPRKPVRTDLGLFETMYSPTELTSFDHEYMRLMTTTALVDADGTRTMGPFHSAQPEYTSLALRPGEKRVAAQAVPVVSRDEEDEEDEDEMEFSGSDSDLEVTDTIPRMPMPPPGVALPHPLTAAAGSGVLGTTNNTVATTTNTSSAIATGPSAAAMMWRPRLAHRSSSFRLRSDRNLRTSAGTSAAARVCRRTDEDPHAWRLSYAFSKPISWQDAVLMRKHSRRVVDIGSLLARAQPLAAQGASAGGGGDYGDGVGDWLHATSSMPDVAGRCGRRVALGSRSSVQLLGSGKPASSSQQQKQQQQVPAAATTTTTTSSGGSGDGQGNGAAATGASAMKDSRARALRQAAVTQSLPPQRRHKEKQPASVLSLFSIMEDNEETPEDDTSAGATADIGARSTQPNTSARASASASKPPPSSSSSSSSASATRARRSQLQRGRSVEEDQSRTGSTSGRDDGDGGDGGHGDGGRGHNHHAHARAERRVMFAPDTVGGGGSGGGKALSATSTPVHARQQERRRRNRSETHASGDVFARHNSTTARGEEGDVAFTHVLPSTSALYTCSSADIASRARTRPSDSRVYEECARVSEQAGRALGPVPSESLRSYAAYLRAHRAIRPTIQAELFQSASQHQQSGGGYGGNDAR
ncbi:hypothetical protein PTSG_09081 [Salpingoeca rosetta]|uniref:SAC domain-containing protein n=1 Tax=Salpingoeca rosetta (strain ATCC 50818 / BSB-021) TaxID=946362 RepID=F2UM54_SALR5|nr:uncharacterized protein PTSG_09081 [Salpingoeca rosetta]EGD78203.1 hypothetical protein PTSG_09081 [Salpingoeca rosetta]|eukprot:XP_004989879.1 hypothetical protein PTSG_09081 [Salpingoeca rosetta]